MALRELDELVRLLSFGHDAGREAAAVAIGRFGATAAAPLAALLCGEDADARWWAARALAEVGGQEAVAPLLTALGDTDPDVRACAALALGHIHAAEAAPALAAVLGDDSAFVASVAADALGMIGEPAVPAIVGMLAHDRPHARLLAVRALDRVRSPSAISPLCGALEDASYLVRYYAEQALENLGAGMLYFQP